MTKNLSSIIQWIPVVAAAVGALIAGLVAFFVSQANERVKRHRKRWFEHRNALERLESLLNEITDIIAANRGNATKAIDAITKNDIGLRIVWSEPHTLPYDSSIRIMFLRIELINEFFSYGVKIRRLNNDTETICRAYSEMRSGLLRQDLSKNQYLLSLTEFQKGLENLLNAYDLMDERTQALLARTRATLLKDKLHDNRSFFGFLLKMPKLENITMVEVDSELKRLRKEIAETQSRSRNEIKQYFGENSL